MSQQQKRRISHNLNYTFIVKRQENYSHIEIEVQEIKYHRRFDFTVKSTFTQPKHFLNHPEMLFLNSFIAVVSYVERDAVLGRQESRDFISLPSSSSRESYKSNLSSPNVINSLTQVNTRTSENYPRCRSSLRLLSVHALRYCFCHSFDKRP